MKVLFAFLLAFAWSANAAISTATKPHTIDSAATPKVSQVDDNDEALLDKINELIDTTNLHNSSGAVVGDLFSSTGDMRLLIDSDNNGTNRWMVTANGATDTLWRVLESGAWKGFGDGYVSGKVVASDSLVGATLRATGNLSAGGTFTASGASTLAALSATTGSFSSTLAVAGNLTLSTLSSGRIPVVSTAGIIIQDNLYWDATNDRLGIGNGASTPLADLFIQKASAGSTVQATIYNSDNTNSSSNGRIVVASGGASGGDAFITQSNQVIDWSFGLDNSDADAFVITPASTLGGATNGLRISTAGAVTMPGTLGVTGAATFSTNVTQSAGVTTISVTDNTANAVDIQEGSANYINVNTTNAAENVSIGNATTNPTVSLLGTGTKTIDGTINTDLTASRTVVTDGSGNLSVNTETGTGSHVKATSPTISGPTFSGTITTPLTASLPVFTNGSSALTTNAVTGTGNVVMSTSPTLVTPTLGVATATSIALGGGEAFTYGDTSFTLTATGMTTSPTGTAYATRIGDVVTLMVPYISGTSNSSSFTFTGIPTGWRPTTIQAVFVPVVTDNSTTMFMVSYGTINSSGVLTLYLNGSSSGWTGSGTKSAQGTITYLLQ